MPGHTLKYFADRLMSALMELNAACERKRRLYALRYHFMRLRIIKWFQYATAHDPAYSGVYMDWVWCEVNNCNAFSVEPMKTNGALSFMMVSTNRERVIERN